MKTYLIYFVLLSLLGFMVGCEEQVQVEFEQSLQIDQHVTLCDLDPSYPITYEVSSVLSAVKYERIGGYQCVSRPVIRTISEITTCEKIDEVKLAQFKELDLIKGDIELCRTLHPEINYD